MSVYFVYRTHYNVPSLNHVKRFDDDNVLAWFKRIWEPLDEDAAEKRVENLFGIDVYGFDSLFTNIEENDLQAPNSINDLKLLLEEHLYYEGEIKVAENCIQVLTDDDEIQLAYYFFDDSYLSNSSHAEFIIRESWNLPHQSDEENIDLSNEEVLLIQQNGGGNGVTYLAFLAFYDSGSLDELTGASKIKGVRLGDLRSFLLGSTPAENSNWPFELNLLRCVCSDAEELREALVAASNYPIARITNSTAWTFDNRNVEESRETLRDLSKQATGSSELNNNSDKLLIQVEQNFAQVSLVAEEWDEDILYFRWIIFDDTWISKNSRLAGSILRYASRWDCLTT